MESILEDQRKLHEERERLEDALVKEKMLKKTTVREKINSEHRMRYLIDRTVETSSQLMSMYTDQDGSRQEEIDAMSGVDQFREFYRRLKRVNEYYSEQGDDFQDDPIMVEFNKMDKDRQNPPEEMQNLVEFTDEEGYGKFLDLHSVYSQYLNIKRMERKDYLSYLQTFDQLYDINKEDKGSEYKKYLESLVDYLLGYIERVQPLVDQTELLIKIKKDFEEKWSQGTFPGWKKDSGTSALAKHSGASLDLTAFNSHEELMSLGLDRLKSALMAQGLKCGGTLEERAKRLFSVKGLSYTEIDPSLFAKSKKSQTGELTEKQKEIAFIEAQVYSYVEMLSEQRGSTKENVERRLARTAEELEEEEEEEEEEEVESEEEDENGVPYNPKNLPLGFDGKPIPYWLYKLHGLNITYECEICGGAQYKGPKSFQRHFSEWRHAFGMRCLGIPNTAHFANVTNIADARALWDKLKGLKAIEQWKSTTEEEFEDSKGNVVSRKMYDDLRRQGLL
ncbi:PREDICTED: splicing factor 3A subunit 3-like [Amphimedon queenslandica]|uniref:Matrin-type domain-containing protein n=1 Tax=Amphimedon queenslandica TaxID=400682 RepID=A0A1X7VNS6_AMPQE|nr:PREDICTED: splicing factor 3A subunit 3-like [Amphimedon queenslandica]|eukprot:XP_003383664.1 PREDICTED: splicing factor 3A subunit 3-like [Amphimedon queenslandica]